MKKIGLIAIILLIMTGCELSNSDDIEKTNNEYIYNFTDKDTCIEYLVYSEKMGYAGAGGITVRYNQDGTIKLNNKCIKENDNG